MDKAARTIVENMMLAAVTRLIVLVGTPTMIGLLAWFAGNFIALQQLTAIQAAEQMRIVADVAELQVYRRDAFARGESMRREDSALRETLREVQQALSRISDRLDRMNVPPRSL